MLLQGRLLNPDIVQLYLVLFSSLISKPDLFSAHRDTIFYCEHNKSRKYVQGMVQPFAWTPEQVFPPCDRNRPWVLPMLGWELSNKLRGNYQLTNGVSFLLLGILLYASFSSWPSLWSCQERMHIALCSFLDLPSFHDCPLGSPKNFTLHNPPRHGPWIDSDLRISLPETLGCHTVPQLIS